MSRSNVEKNLSQTLRTSIGKWGQQLRCFCCKRRERSQEDEEVTADVIVRKWWKRFIERRLDLTKEEEGEEGVEAEEEPTTSSRQWQLTFVDDWETKIPEDLDSSSMQETVVQEKTPKSIMKRQEHRTVEVSVRFLTPEPSEEGSVSKSVCIERCQEFCRRSICKYIVCIVFGILLPCCLVYPGLYYLYQVRRKKSKS